MKNKKLLLIAVLMYAAGYGIHTYAAAEVTPRQLFEQAYENGDWKIAKNVLERGSLSMDTINTIRENSASWGKTNPTIQKNRYKIDKLINAQKSQQQLHESQKADVHLARLLQAKDDAAAMRHRKNQRDKPAAAIAKCNEDGVVCPQCTFINEPGAQESEVCRATLDTGE